MKKSDIYGVIGSVLSLILLFLLLWFIVLPGQEPKIEDEGIMVSFGNTDDGSGMTETPMETPSTPSIPPPAPKAPAPKAVKQDLMTQTTNSLAIQEQKRKEKEKKEQERAEQETIRQQQEAIRQQQLEQERKIAEKKRKEQEAIDKANAAMGGFGNNNNSSGSGTGSGDTNQGNPLGKGNSGGNSWSLNGRSLTGRLVSPNYDKDVEGKITVTIRVNQSGNVISAAIGSPTTISDAQTRTAAINAAKSTRFTAGKDISSGSITYNFKLN